MTVVAIDGPAGAGKSSVARAVARALEFDYVDTGAMYRAVTLAALERGVGVRDANAMGQLARSIDVRLQNERLSVDGRDITELIRNRAVTAAVSQASAHPGVRAALVEKQRAIAQAGNVVMEGRDIGTTVAPDAAVKIFLTASLEERARRRSRDEGLTAGPATVRRVSEELAARDAADASRAASPFTRPEDATVIESTNKDLDAVVAEVVAVVQRALHHG